jgi:hypothetical protein
VAFGDNLAHFDVCNEFLGVGSLMKSLMFEIRCSCEARAWKVQNSMRKVNHVTPNFFDVLSPHLTLTTSNPLKKRSNARTIDCLCAGEFLWAF